MKATETYGIVPILAPSDDVFDGDPESLRVNLSKAKHAALILYLGGESTGTGKIKVVASDAVTAGNAEFIDFPIRKATDEDNFGDLIDVVAATGYTTTAGADGDVYVAEIDARALPEGKPWVGLDLTEVVDDPVFGSAIAILSGPYYATSPMPTFRE